MSDNELLVPIIKEMSNIQLMTEGDCAFLIDNKEHLTAIMQKTHMWRTNTQKLSILNDVHFPTLHSKFHQAILEQKVQLDQSFYLAKDFEEKRLEIEELELDADELGDSKRDDIKRRKITLQIQFKQYELNQMRTAMKYRMDEVKGWQSIIDEILTELREAGIDEKTIWNKDAGEVESMFFLTLNNLQGLNKTTDSAEASNLVALAQSAIQMAKQLGKLDEWKARCTPAQLNSLQFFNIR